MARDQMTGALPRAAVDPLGLETEGRELRLEHAADAAHAFEVHRAAVDVDDALEQRDRFVGVGVDIRRGRTLRGREVW